MILESETLRVGIKRSTGWTSKNRRKGEIRNAGDSARSAPGMRCGPDHLDRLFVADCRARSHDTELRKTRLSAWIAGCLGEVVPPSPHPRIVPAFHVDVQFINGSWAVGRQLTLTPHCGTEAFKLAGCRSIWRISSRGAWDSSHKTKCRRIF